MAPDCAHYGETLELASTLLAPDGLAQEWLKTYLTGNFTGAEFDRRIDHEHPNEFTDQDFDALPYLGNVRLMSEARSWLTGEGHATVVGLLERIPSDVDIWEVEPDQFDDVLGDQSPTWGLWTLVRDRQPSRARRIGRGVTAGKLLHGKRPRLVPIFDSRVEQALRISKTTVWEAYWCTLRDEDVRGRLEGLQQAVPEAANLSTLRVLDIVAWMSINTKGRS